MLKEPSTYGEKLANKTFLLDKYDLGTESNAGKRPPEDLKEHLGIRFENVDKLEDYKQIQQNYEGCLKLNQLWNSYIDNLIGPRYAQNSQ